MGPEPSKIEPWSAMDYGPSLTHTYQIPGTPNNFAYKGIAIRLDQGPGGVSRGRDWMIFDMDTFRVAAAWHATDDAKEKFVDWKGIQFNGQHQIHPNIVGAQHFSNSVGPGWAHPDRASFDDTDRVVGRDGRRYGPLPSDWAKFLGTYHHGQQTIVSYRIGSTSILESPSWRASDVTSQPGWILRSFEIGPRSKPLVLQVAQSHGGWSIEESTSTVVEGSNDSAAFKSFGVYPKSDSVDWQVNDQQLRLRIAAGKEPLRFAVWMTKATATDLRPPVLSQKDLDLQSLTKGGPGRWGTKITTRAILGQSEGPFVADVLTAPESNPWLALTRFTGLDFLPDGRIALCTWDGDVWLVEQKNDGSEVASSEAKSQTKGAHPLSLEWRRIASGLFQP